MQSKARGAVLALFMTSLLVAPIAEAKRAGGGKSSGMSRTQTSSQTTPQQNNMNRTQQPTTPTQVAPQPQKSGSNVGGMVAAGVAGAAIGAVAMNAMADDDTAANPQAAVADNEAAQAPTQEEGGMGWLWIVILAAIAFFVFRKFKAKKSEATNPYAPNSAGNGRQTPQAPFGQPSATNTASNTNIFGQQLGANPSTQAPVAGFGGAYTNSGNQLPDGTEPATFLRFARQRFNHIQAMNTASNIEEIRRYFTPEMYQAIYQDISSNSDVAEFSNLLANVVEQTTENGQYVVSVRFSGMVSEDINSQSVPFTEIWHFVKPEGSQEEWVVAGIQQA